MLSAYAESRDLHTLTAQNLTGSTEVSKDDRKLAKVVNFRLLYEMRAKGIQSYAPRSYGVEMSVDEAALYLTKGEPSACPDETVVDGLSSGS